MQQLCVPEGGYLLLHDGGGARNAMAVQGGIDGVAGALEEGASNALRTGSHRCSVLTAQLLDQLGKLSPQVWTCTTPYPHVSMVQSSRCATQVCGAVFTLCEVHQHAVYDVNQATNASFAQDCQANKRGIGSKWFWRVGPCESGGVDAA